MTISCERLPAYLSTWGDKPVRLMNFGGTRKIGDITLSRAFELVHVEAIFGIGTPSRLRYVQYQVSPDKAEAEIVKRSRSREECPLDTLRKMISSRKTTEREYFTQLCPWTNKQERNGLWTIRHKMSAV